MIQVSLSPAGEDVRRSDHSHIFERARTRLIPYDAILPYVEVLVSSREYGGITHAIFNTILLVHYSWLEDKSDMTLMDDTVLSHACPGGLLRTSKPIKVTFMINKAIAKVNPFPAGTFRVGA